MKKRNQLVSALLTGMLLGGTATATMSTTPVDAAAEESKADIAADTDAGDGADEETVQEEVPEAEDTEEEESSSLSAAAAEEETEADTVEAETAGDAESTDSGAEPADSSAESADSSTESTDSSAESADSGAESADSGAESTDSGAESTDSGAESTDSGAESTDSGAESTDSELTEEEKKQLEAEALLAEQEKAEAEAREAEKRDEARRQEEARQAREEERIRKTAEAADRAAKAKMDKEAAAKAAAEKAAEAEKAAQAARRYGYAASNRAYYSGSYFVTNAQKRLALNVGFTKIEKTPAMAASSENVHIREMKSDGGRVVGTLHAKDICYILADEGSDWVYVESGEVRGFVRADALKSGAEVRDYADAAGEDALTTAVQEVDPLDNTAYRYSLNTTKDVASILQALGTASVDRQAMIAFAKQFIGNPYVWGGESLTSGCDCSGFTQQVYAQFGIALPRTSYEQADVGVKIPKEEAIPGDLLFYARDGVVYHVLMYVGDGKAINASSSATGIVIQDVDYSKVCWACRYISDTGAAAVQTAVQMTSTQASSLQAIGQMAYSGDPAAQEEIIEALAQASLKEWRTYGFCRSVIIAQAINESGWLSFGSSAAGIQSTDNNILGMNEDLNNSLWASPWDGKAATRLVPQYAGGGDVYNFESMRLYDDMEGCMEDYAAFKVSLHPDLIGETDVDKVIAVGLAGYATNPNYQSEVRALIDRYDLTRFDSEETGAKGPEASVVEPVDTFANELPEDIYEADVPAETEEELTEGLDIVEAETDEEAVEAADDEEIPEAEPEKEPEVIPADVTPADEEVLLPAQAEAEPGDEPQFEEVAVAHEEPQTEVKETAEACEEPLAAVEEAVEAGGSDAEAAEETGIAVTADTGVAEETRTVEADEEALPDAEATVSVVTNSSGVRIDTTEYTQEQMEIIWAAVAQADDTSYDGALAVISSVMNRADMNYGGFGESAFSQITAESQYACSPDVEDPLYYERRLGGNVPDFVKQAISDCLTGGIRNNSYTSFRSEDTVEGGVRIGSNWYFYETAANAAEAIANMADVIGDIAEEIPADGYVDGGVTGEPVETAAYAEPEEPADTGAYVVYDEETVVGVPIFEEPEYEAPEEEPVPAGTVLAVPDEEL